MSIKICQVIFLLLFITTTTIAQDSLINASNAKKALLKDSLDGKFDFSPFLLNPKGFIPVPMIITEPALGGFGGAIAPLFLTPKKDLPPNSGYVAPDITLGFAMYTANNSWGLGVGRIGSIPKMGIKYRLMGGYTNLNLAFYRELPGLGEKEFQFSIVAVPILLSISKKILKDGLYAGLEYSWSSTKLTPRFNSDLPDFIKPKELYNHTAGLGLFLDLDKRNTIFTPDKGFRTNLMFTVSDNWTGSDFAYQKLDGFFNWFKPVKTNWVSGLRFEAKYVFGDAPFYLQPGINMRGIAAARYQGQSTIVLETEQRFDLNRRWSVLGFAGYGQAVAKNQHVGSGTNVYSVGTGFRYLIARVFGIRSGIDIAKGPDSWGWYIVFGHNWNR